MIDKREARIGAGRPGIHFSPFGTKARRGDDIWRRGSLVRIKIFGSKFLSRCARNAEREGGATCTVPSSLLLALSAQNLSLSSPLVQIGFRSALAAGGELLRALFETDTGVG